MLMGEKSHRFPALACLLAATALGTISCRTTTEDVDRWANTMQGPRKLIAVLTHDKFPIDLRVEAALSLIRMKPRSGRAVGLQGSDEQIGLVDALSQLPAAERSQVVARLAPRLEEAMKRVPAPGEPDESYPYKDAAFAILTHDDGALVTDGKIRGRLRAALAEWAVNNFSERMDDSSQLYGMDQVLRELKADGVRPLPELIPENQKKIDRIASLVAELGDTETKVKTAETLVAVARKVDSEAWVKDKEPVVEAANKASKLHPTPEQFRAQLEQYQEEELLRVFSSMKQVGQGPIVEYLLDYANNVHNPDKRRAAALAALEGNLNRNDAKHAEAILAIASNKETPDAVRDVALRRVAEMPRHLVIDDLYRLFSEDNWKVRWVAAELVLQMSQTEHLDEFMRKLGAVKKLALTEPLRYGALIAKLKGNPKPGALIDRFAERGKPVPARLTALGYYYAQGKANELPKVQKYASDSTRVPRCSEDVEGCEWRCAIGEGEKQELKEIATVGDFVEYCVEPAMRKRSSPEQKNGKGRD